MQESTEANHEPPAHLSERSATFWRDVVPRRAKSPGKIAIARSALEALDRADVARAGVEVAGMTTTAKTIGTVHVHPLVKVERESRAQFTKLWGSLNLMHDFAAGDR